MNEVLARTKLVGQRAGEPALDIELCIGTPYQVSSDPEEWACPVALAPLYKRLSDVRGGDSFHALCLAIRLALQLLEAFRDEGGVLSMSSGEEFPIDLYSSGLAKGVFGDAGPAELDDGLRGPVGVICSVREREDGRLRLVLDDVRNSAQPLPGPWSHSSLFTWKDYDPSVSAYPENLPDDEMAALGFSVLVRLMVMHRHGKG